MGKTAKQRQEIKQKAQPEKREFDPAKDGYHAMASFVNKAQERGATAEQAFQSLLGACVLGIQMAGGDASLMFLSAVAMTGMPQEEVLEAIKLVYEGASTQQIVKAIQQKKSVKLDPTSSG